MNSSYTEQDMCVCVCDKEREREKKGGGGASEVAHKRTVPYNLPLLFIATNSPLLTPNRLITPRSTVEISIRPERNILLGKQRHKSHCDWG